MPDDRQPWFVVVDPQRIFADPTSEWGSPMFDAALGPIKSLRSGFGAQRTIVTRWVPGPERPGSWGPYFERWGFADRPATDPVFDLVTPAAGWSSRGSIDLSTFGKIIGGGMPVGALVSFGPQVSGLLTAGQHGTTFGGNPVSCAAAGAVLRTVDDDFLAEVRRKGQVLIDEASRLPGVEDVRWSRCTVAVMIAPRQCLNRSL